jgi:hypothetical protein
MTDEQAIELWKLLTIYCRTYDENENKITAGDIRGDIEESLTDDKLMELNV